MQKLLQTILFHGTDEYIHSMSKEDRITMKTHCFLILETLLAVYKQNDFDRIYSGKQNPKEINDILDCYIASDSALSKNKYYQYDNIYLSTSIREAMKFAKTASHYGELGYLAWKLYEGISILNYELPILDEKHKNALNSIIDFAKHDSKPVIYAFKLLPIECLVEENGRKQELEIFLDKETGRISGCVNVRYIGDLSFDGKNVYKLSAEEQDYLIKREGERGTIYN